MLKDRLQQEIRLKEEYHMSFKRAQFDLDKDKERVQTERLQFREKVDMLEHAAVEKQTKIEGQLREIETLKDENHRLKNTVVNKDSQN